MKISELDRRRAIKRIPEFIEDLEQYEKSKESLGSMKEGPERRKFFEEIILYENNIQGKWGYTIDAITHADEMAKNKKKVPSVRPVTSIDKIPMTKYTISRTKKNEKIVKTWIEGECLYLKADLFQAQKKLVDDFVDVIKRYQDALIDRNKKKERQGETTQDIWEIYDLHIKDGLPILEIARRLHGKEYPRGERAPAYTDELWKPYKQVERAYEKAEKIIQTISSSLPNRSSENDV